MRNTVVATLAAATLSLIATAAACSKKKADPAPAAAGADNGQGTAVRGLPALGENRMGVHEPDTTGAAPGGADPHAGMPKGGQVDDPHAGLGMGGGPDDPHAGMDMGAGGDDPHAGMDTAGQDTNPHAGTPTGVSIEGEIHLDPKMKSGVPKGATIFLSARNLKTKTVVSVARVTFDGTFPIKFKLETAMNGPGMSANDKVLVSANVDKDKDPMKKQGEVEAMIETVAPAKGVKLTLDHIREAP